VVLFYRKKEAQKEEENSNALRNALRNVTVTAVDAETDTEKESTPLVPSLPAEDVQRRRFCYRLRNCYSLAKKLPATRLKV